MKSFKLKENIYNVLALIILLIIAINMVIMVSSTHNTFNLALKGGFTVLYLACIAALLFTRENSGKSKVQSTFAIILIINMISSLFLGLITFSVSLTGLVLGIALLLSADFNYTLKKVFLFASALPVGLLIAADRLELFNIGTQTTSVVTFTTNMTLMAIFLGATLFSFYLLSLKSQVVPKTENERAAYEKSSTIEDLKDNIIRLNEKLDLNHPGRNNLKLLFGKIESKNRAIKEYLEEYKMMKRDLPLAVCTSNIDKNLDKLSSLIENHNNDEETVNSCELTLNKENMVLEVKRSKDRYEIPLKGILYKIIYHLMDKLVTDIKNKVFNYDIKGFIEREKLEEKVFGEVCGKNRLNTNITRIRALFSQIGLDIDLIESRDSMIRLKTISDKVSIVENEESQKSLKIG